MAWSGTNGCAGSGAGIRWLAVAMLLALTACGGQDEPPTADWRSDTGADLRRTALATGSETAVPRVASLLFDFAEQNFSSLFPSRREDRLAGALAYRYYPESQAYLIVDVRTRQVYVLGLPPPNGPQLIDVGNALDYLPAPTLTVVRSGTGAGTIDSQPAGISCGDMCSYPTFGWDQQVTLTATPTRDSVVTWTGACSGTARTCALTLVESLSVGVQFDVPVLSVSVTGNGSVRAASVGIDCGVRCTATIPAGTLVTLTAAAPAGSRFAGWSGACSGTSGTCVVLMNQALRPVSAMFQAAGG